MRHLVAPRRMSDICLSGITVCLHARASREPGACRGGPLPFRLGPLRVHMKRGRFRYRHPRASYFRMWLSGLLELSTTHPEEERALRVVEILICSAASDF